MATNISRAATSAAVGVASAAAESATLTPIQMGGQAIKYSTIVELLAVLGGAGMQFFSPYTMPNVVDGLVDGGLALVARRGAYAVLKQTMPTNYPMYAHRIGGAYVSPQLSAAGYGAYGQIGAVSRVPRRSLT